MLITLQNTTKGTCYAIKFDRYRRQVIDKFKESVRGRWWDSKSGLWMVPATAIGKADLDQFTYFVKYFEAVEWGGTKNISINPVDRMPDLSIPHQLKKEPYLYQRKGIARGLQLKRFINADDMGLGKTMQSIATINIANAFPCLVICPSTVKLNWVREWTMFTDKKAMVLTDSVRDSWPFFWQTGLNHVFIVNYESLKKFFVRRIAKSKGWVLADVTFNPNISFFKSVIIDESHRVKSTKTQQSKFCKGICEGKEYIIELTGTPVVNKPKDLLCQLGILGRIGEFGGYSEFLNRYCSGKKKAANLQELNRELWKHCFFRREKSAVLKELPDKVRQIIRVNISNRDEYKAAEDDLKEYLQKYKDADDEKVQNVMRSKALVQLGVLRNIAARGKMKDVIEFISDFLENDKKLIVFCNLHEIVDQLRLAFPFAVSVTGRENYQQKQMSVDSFMKNSKTSLIICSIKAASAGITLTASSNVAFIELPWTYADCDQAESRAHRIGQKDSVNCYYLLARRTIDGKMYRIIQDKKSISNAVLGAEDNIPVNIIDSMAQLFNNEENEDEF